jgi:hypothetical protein
MSQRDAGSQHRRRAPAAGAAALLLAFALAGCSIIDIRPLDPALFPAAGKLPDAREPVQVVMSLSEPAQSYTSPSITFRAARVQLPIARIVEAAAERALREQFESVTLVPTQSQGLQIVLSQIAPEVTSQLIYVLPVPGGVIDRVDVSSRMTFTLAALAPDGRTRFSRSYDSGMERVQPRREHLLSQEPLATALQRSLHEQAVRLARLAATDLRDWLAQERLRERVL